MHSCTLGFLNLLQVPCFTLESMMLVLNRTTIDFFSLDVEGAELKVLKSIDFNKLNIRTLTVEYAHVKGGKAGLVELLNKNGMKLYKTIVDNSIWARDLFFINNNTQP